MRSPRSFEVLSTSCWVGRLVIAAGLAFQANRLDRWSRPALASPVRSGVRNIRCPALLSTGTHRSSSGDSALQILHEALSALISRSGPAPGPARLRAPSPPSLDFFLPIEAAIARYASTCGPPIGAASLVHTRQDYDFRSIHDVEERVWESAEDDPTDIAPYRDIHLRGLRD